MVGQSTGSTFGRICIYGMLIILSIMFIMPLYWLVTNSFQLVGSSSTFLPTSFHFENYYYALTLIDYWGFARNSIIITGISVVIPTITSAFVGFGFARLRGPGKGFLFMMMLSTMMLPGIVTQIPTYVIFFKMGFINTFWPWLFWALGGSAFSIFLYRQFFASFPKDIEEAARIDGCSTFRIFWNIFVPISLPVIATVSILAFNGSWGGDYLTPFMFLRDDKYPLATALFSVGYVFPSGQQKIEMTQVLSAGLVMFVLPIIVVFFIGQRYLVEGVVSSAVKG
ncbi:multiple sugar transport system permease protein [Paenibacillus anaericanus]|uniref:carbohydrate ABC transporter permease n=1 Tax=Paenibacillus anaericanus TaxID=170367 RepID=UPI002784E6C3|nr:carbohydrate ABC transporter permease [Paenibacillus anaericanus]MDQ0090744.1 multiple sugar transport system permease protein [Paenibacillus anaericanus]